MNNTNKKVIEKSVSECCGAYPRWNSLIDEFVCQKCIKACRILPTPSSEKRIGGAEFHMFGQDYERNYSHTHCWNQGKSPACGQPLENHKQCCLCDTPSPQPSSWEKEFDNLIPRNIGQDTEFGYKLEDGDNIWTVTDWGNIRKFIRKIYLQAQTEEKRRIVGKIEGIERGIEWMQEGRHKDLKGYTKGFNQALDDIINLINK